MTSEPHRRTIGSLRAVALDAPDIDRLATFYEQLAGWQRVPDDDDEWITLDTGDGWRMGLQRAIDHVSPHWPDQDRPPARLVILRTRTPLVSGACLHPVPGTDKPLLKRTPAAPMLELHDRRKRQPSALVLANLAQAPLPPRASRPAGKGNPRCSNPRDRMMKRLTH